MKFTLGYWLHKPGVSAYGAADLRGTERYGDTLRLYVAPQNIDHRGQTLAGPLLTIDISAPLEDVLRVRTLHFAGSLTKQPAFPLNLKPVPLALEESEETLTIKAGKMRLVVAKRPFSMSYYYEDRFLTRSDPKQLAYLKTPEGAFVRERLAISVGETFYGLGERFGAFVKNGQSVDIWNEDGGTASEYAYKNIPFYLSSRGYGVFVNHTERVSLELGSEAVSKAQFSVPGEQLDYMVIGGGSMARALSRYTALSGRAVMPPAWTFGLWLSTSFTTNYDETTVNSFIDGMFARDIPLSVFHFDCFWMREYEWCNFAWDAAQFPDVPGMLGRLHDKGLRVCVWINPYIGQKSPLFAEAMAAGYLIGRQGGGVYQSDQWQPGMGIVDFTNPEAYAWYQEKLKALLDMGVDAFKTDFGERIPEEGVYHSGEHPQGMHNFYAYLYNQCVFSLLERERGRGEAAVFARSATTGCQQLPLHWGGDCEASFTAMAESLRGGLSLAMGGFAFWSHDIGGFEHTASATVYKRWVAFGLLSTHSRLHGSGSYRVPWLYDEEAVDVLRFFTKNKHRLMPYLYAQSLKACAEGLPVMRPMVLAYPGDSLCAYLDRQYMLGESLLVAPVFHDDGLCEFYLPEGRFTHLFDDTVADGGKMQRRSCDFFDLPLYVCENTLLPLGTDTSAVYSYADLAEIHVYELKNASIEVYNPGETEPLNISAKREGDTVILRVSPAARDVDFVFHNLTARDERAVREGGGFRLRYPAGAESVTLAL